MTRPAKFSLDLEDNVIDSGILDTEPFPVTYKQTNRSLPNFSATSSSSEQTLATFAEAHVSMDEIQACISQVFPSMKIAARYHLLSIKTTFVSSLLKTKLSDMIRHRRSIVIHHHSM
jgi:hypothetical protein